MPQKTNAYSPRILFVEDEEALAEGICYNLSAEGYQVQWVKDGAAALKAFQKQKIDLIILDIMLPYIDGFEVARRILQAAPQQPILMLTARTAVADRVKGLEIGAEDYLTKPFHLQELLARIRAMLRRKAWYQAATFDQETYQFGPNEINFNNHECRSGHKKFRLTQHEAMLLKYFIENKGKILSRKELLEKVWNISADVETRTVDIFVARLRKYFEPNPKKPRYIKSIRGSGYLFED